jgi:hypothetical protein
MKTYVQADAAGRILSRVTQANDHPAPAGFVEVAQHDVNPGTHYLVAGVVTAYTAEERDRLAARPSHPAAWDMATKTWVDARPLPALKAAKWRAIKAARDAAEFGTFACDGNTFDSDLASQSRIQGAVQLAKLLGPAFTIDWTLADNSVVTLDAAEMQAVGLALAQHVQTVHAAGRTLRAQIEAATTKADLDAIEW